MIQPVSKPFYQPMSRARHLAPPPLFSHHPPSRAASVQFGMVGGVFKNLVVNTAKDNQKEGKGLSRFFSIGGFITFALTVLFANADLTVSKIRESRNMYGAPALEVVLENYPDAPDGQTEAPGPNGLTRSEVEAAIEQYRRDDLAWMPPQMLETFVKAGLVDRILTPDDFSKTIVTGLKGWRARLIDGREILVNTDLKTAEKYYQEYGIPTDNVLSGLTMSWLEAAILAGTLGMPLAGFIEALIGRFGRKKKPPAPKQLPLADRQREATFKAGVFLVAKKLGASKVLMTEEEVVTRAEKMRPSAEDPSFTRTGLKNRLQVLLAGGLAELKLYDDPSLESLGTNAMATHIADFMVRHLGMGSVFKDRPYPEKLTAEDETQIREETQKLVDEAVAGAKAFLEEYSNEQITALRDALVEKPDLSDGEAQAVLQGSANA